jgi:hypothetical protein
VIPKPLIAEITKWIDEKRYGNIQINFSAGKIVNYNVTQSLRVDLTFTNSPETKVSASVSHEGDALA